MLKKLAAVFAGMMAVALLIGLYFYIHIESLALPQAPHGGDQTEQGQAERDIEQTQLQAVNQENPAYSLQRDNVHITFDNGSNWQEVPVTKEQLFAGEYQGNEQALIPGSFVLNEHTAAFLYTELPHNDVSRIMLAYSQDEGGHWKTSVVVDESSPIRFRKIEFVDETFGYAILSSGRTMSQEYSAVYITNDSGETWEAATDPPATRMLAFGGFVDKVTGFLSYGTINPDEPDVYVTQDGGEDWEAAVFNVPEKYEQIFVQAEVPIREGNQLKVLVNQGPNGDYEGGKIKGEFISEDNGLTWEFSKEVEPDEKG